MKFLTDEQLNELLPAETSSFPSPVPTQIVSSDEYLPVPQTEKQRELEARLKELSDRLARRHGSVVPGDEPGLWPPFRRQRGGGSDTGYGVRARRRSLKTIHH